jgi:L-rhamnose mutarotase
MGEKMRFLLISVLALSITTFAQEDNSREFADGVIELTTVKVKTNFLQDYLDGIEKTWVAAAKIQQEMGIISNYNVYIGNDGSTVYLTQTYPSWANKAPWTDEQTSEFQKKFNEVMSDEDNTEMSKGYEDIREIVSVELIGRLVFN